MVATGLFREDLYYRICVIRIGIPPLRDRMEDLPVYTEHLMKRIGARIGKEVPRIGRSAWKALLTYSYPGNIRELENLLEVAMVLDEDGILSIQDLPDFEGARRVRQDLGIAEHAVALTFESVPTLAEMEKAFLARAQELIPSKKDLSRVLGIARSTLYRKLEDYDLMKSEDS
jgi:DNA-binding NtrC family response regulator